jgi:hypothetical protein
LYYSSYLLAGVEDTLLLLKLAVLDESQVYGTVDEVEKD